jgi:hypothetical protein
MQGWTGRMALDGPVQVAYVWSNGMAAMSEADKAARQKIIAATLAEAVQARVAELQQAGRHGKALTGEAQGRSDRAAESPREPLPRRS